MVHWILLCLPQVHSPMGISQVSRAVCTHITQNPYVSIWQWYSCSSGSGCSKVATSISWTSPTKQALRLREDVTRPGRIFTLKGGLDPRAVGVWQTVGFSVWVQSHERVTQRMFPSTDQCLGTGCLVHGFSLHHKPRLVVFPILIL